VSERPESDPAGPGEAQAGVPPGLAVLVQGSLDHVREVRRVLGRDGVQSQLLAPPEGCGSS
jgi:hypothetical protein